MAYYHADSCAISPLAFLLLSGKEGALEPLNFTPRFTVYSAICFKIMSIKIQVPNISSILLLQIYLKNSPDFIQPNKMP